MKALYKSHSTTEERLSVIHSLAHPGDAFKLIRIEATDIVNRFTDKDPTRGLHFTPGLFIKNVHMHVLPLLGLVQGKTATLPEEDTYAIVLSPSNQVTGINIGNNPPDNYLLLDYSQFEKLKSDAERINFLVAVTKQTFWPLVKITLYEGYDQQLNCSAFTGFRVNTQKTTFGHYHYSAVELANTERKLFDDGVFLHHINKAIVAGQKNQIIPAIDLAKPEKQPAN